MTVKLHESKLIINYSSHQKSHGKFLLELETHKTFRFNHKRIALLRNKMYSTHS